MKTEITRRALGGATVIFGLYWLWGTIVQPFFLGAGIEKEELSSIFIFMFFAFMSGPGILAVAFGFRLFKNETVMNVKAVVGLFCVIGVIFLAASLKVNLPDIFLETYERDVFMLIAMVVGGAVYLFSTSFFLRCLNLGNEKPNTTVEKVLLVLIALRLWMFLSQIGESYFPEEEDSEKLMKEPFLLTLNLIKLIIPIAIPIVFYKSMSGWLDRRQAEQSAAEQPATRLQSKSK